jgi:hypothetical protein
MIPDLGKELEDDIPYKEKPKIIPVVDSDKVQPGTIYVGRRENV